MMDEPHRLHRRDFFLLAAFCLLLFGFELFSGRALSLHEARLPETAREMLASHDWHDWVFPQSGGRPWLERPPVPHWILIGTSLLLGQRCDTVWVVRLPSAIMGTLVVLLTAWMGGKWFGRNVGLLSGFVLATMYEFYAYSVLAEDDIFLAATVALAVAAFVRLEFFSGKERDGRVAFFGNRPWEVWAFYFLLGLTNMVKSPLVGAVVVLAPVAVFIIWASLSVAGYVHPRLRRRIVAIKSRVIVRVRDTVRVRRYCWFWGWLIFAVLLVAWPLAAAHKYPDVWRNWKFDYG
ncbi:MAG TPA: phospholipid carrier-dependent glycosyltransferase, partial [Tepidisphaeraceae bacterium]|nr:phospholipid carrier-dependent glycosyltransferase [Tepidisphaeraceae bacterium]